MNLLLLCSHSPNDVTHEPQRNVCIAAGRGAVRTSSQCLTVFSILVIWISQFLVTLLLLRGPGGYFHFYCILHRNSC